MTAEIIPADVDRGEFRITDQMMSDAGAVSMGAFEFLLREEARHRHLDLRIELEAQTKDVIVRWRPGATESSGGTE
jgi:hypothetical protein